MIASKCWKCGVQYPYDYTIGQCCEHIKACVGNKTKLRHCLNCNTLLLDPRKGLKSSKSYIVTTQPFCNGICRKKYHSKVLKKLKSSTSH